MLVAGPHFRLLTLGVPMLVTAAGEVVRYRTRKHFALLIRLALEPGRKFVRDYLIDLLWPDAPQEHGRHSLSQAITVMRKTVGREFVAAQRNTLALGDGVIDVDALRLETCDAEIRGRFLEGFDLRGARGFDEWREGWSARLHPKIRDCLVKHMDAARRLGDFATVEQHAIVLEDLDPHSEDALRGIMEAREWVGDRSNALKAFNRFSTRMAEELGAKPTPELERVANLLREGRRAAPRPTPEGVPPREERRFEPEAIIGRQREFSVLYDAWLEVRQRKPRVMVVLGDPGIGKTTLTNSFVSSCQMDGAVIARAQAYDAERELPYAVLAELVRQLTLQRAIGSAEPEALAELSRLTPEVLTVFPGVPTPAEWPPEVVPLRLADAFLKAVTAAAEDNPVVLVVDDLHAADNATVGILHMLARKVSGLRLMLIMAGRLTELRNSEPPGALAADPAIEGLQIVLLEGFAENTGAQLVMRVADENGGTAKGAPIERILRAGSGNPLAIALLTREWLVHGEDSLLKQLEALDRLPVPILGIPIAVRAVFERQTRRLEARTRGVLDLAAILGRRLGDLELYAIVDCTPGEAAIGLSELLASGLVREVRGQLEFRNELIRAQAYYGVAEPVRRQLHRGVAAAIAAGSLLEASGPRLEVAWHFLRGGDFDKALPYAKAGAEDSISAGAPSEAEQILSVFLFQAPTLLGRQSRILLAKALLDQSKATRAIPILEALSLDEDMVPLDCAEIALLRARAEHLLNRESGRKYCESAARALSASRASESKKILLRALFESARAGAEIGDEETLLAAYEELKKLVAERAYADLHDAHYAIAFCESALGYAFSAETHIRRALTLIGPDGSVTQLSRIYNGLGAINLQLCNVTEAYDAFSRALQLVNKIGDDSRASTIAANICTGLTMAGKYEEALSFGRYAVESGGRVPSPLFVTAYSNMVDAYVLTGRPEEARCCIANAREWFRQDRSLFARLALLVEAAGLELMLGSEESFIEALEYLESELSGGVPYFVHRGVIAKYAARRDGLMNRIDQAFDRVTAVCETFRNECPVAYLDTLAAKAWLETRSTGRSESKQELVKLLDQYDLPGKRATLEREGFLSSLDRC